MSTIGALSATPAVEPNDGAPYAYTLPPVTAPALDESSATSRPTSSRTTDRRVTAASCTPHPPGWWFVSPNPVLLVHGFASSFALNWQESGLSFLLEDAGREVIGVDLLGHGSAPKPHDPAAYADLGARVVDMLPDVPVDA